MSKKIISIFLSSVIVISTMFCTNNIIFAASTTEYNKTLDFIVVRTNTRLSIPRKEPLK